MSDPIEDELRAAQADVIAAPARRRAAVTKARETDRQHWTVYRLAKTLGVDQSTVRAILKAAQKHDDATVATINKRKGEQR